MRTYPTPPLVELTFTIVTLASLPSSAYVYEVIEYFLAQFPSLSAKGISGYHYIFHDFQPDPNGPRVSGILGSVVLQDTQNTADILAIYAPMFAYIPARWPGYAVTPMPAVRKTFLEWYNVHYDMSAAGTNSYTCSRLLDGKALTAGAMTREAVQGFIGPRGAATVYLVSGPGVWNSPARGGGNSVLPAWRRAYVHASELFFCAKPCCGVMAKGSVASGADFLPFNKTSQEAAFAEIDSVIAPLRKLAPDMGAYMNEVSEPSGKRLFCAA
jgi:hypothetical protein